MAIKPILFNTEMVRAILDGRKTVTRRVMQRQPVLNGTIWSVFGVTWSDGTKNIKPVYGQLLYYNAPYQPGDTIYVKETWNICNMYEDEENYISFVYKSDENEIAGSRTVVVSGEVFKKYENTMAENNPEWRPSIHMPKEAARIWLRVTDVRVERLQDITREQAIKEGCQGALCDHANADFNGCTDCMNSGFIEPPELEFLELWDSTIKKPDRDRYGWDANPWVWVIEFERCDNPREG